MHPVPPLRVGEEIEKGDAQTTLFDTIKWPGWSLRAASWMLMAVLVVSFFRNWMGGGLPNSPRSEALAHYTYIWQIADYLRAGQLYVDWDPTFFAGYPWLRFLQYPVYYVVAVLSLLPGVSFPLAIKLFVITTYVTSAWMMGELVYTALSSNRNPQAIAWGAATVAGTAYALFPFHLHLGIEIISHGAFWAILPLPFLVYEKITGRMGQKRIPLSRPSSLRGDGAASWSEGIWLGLALALYVVTDIEHTVIMLPFVGFYMLLRSLPVLRSQWPRLARVVLIAGLVAAGLTAFYILPGLADLGRVGITARFGADGTASAQFARDTGISPGALLAALADRAGVTYRPADLPYIVFGFFGANTWYLGVATCALAMLGLVGLRRFPVVAVSVLLLLVSFAWAARAWLPVNLFASIPFFGTLSGFRGMILLGFFLCLLAGFGATWLLSSLKKWPAWAILAALTLAVLAIDRPRPTVSYAAEVVGLLALLVLTTPVAHRVQTATIILAVLLLLGLIATDYRTANAAIVSVPAYFQADELNAYRWLNSQGGGFRVWEYSDLYDDAEFLYTFSVAYNQTPRFGGYYDNGAPRAQWALYKWAKPERGVTSSPESLGVALRLSSVRYVLVHTRTVTFDQAVSTMKEAGFDKVAWQSAHVTILEDRHWQPLARIYSRVLPVAGGYGEELTHLAAADRAQTAIVAQTDAAKADTRLTEATATVPARVTRLNPYQIRVQTDSPAPGMLVLSETWHPNWQVTVDGQPATVERANVAFMGVRLDAGKHDVLYSYLPTTLVAGWMVTAATVLALMVAAIVTKRALKRSS